jgi:LacI family transcriptional regulator
MKSARITLKDISNVCGYTVNTVSRALRDDPRLPESTRVLIQKTAQDMGYIRNSLASSLRSGRSHVVAVIVNDLRNQHFSDLLNRMDQELRKADYSLMILCMQLDDSLAEKLIHTAISLGVDGILYFPNFSQRHYIEYMTVNNMPFVLLDRRVNDVEADTVRCDDEQGGYLAGQHLAGLGHKKFLFLSGIEKSSSQMDRYSGFIRAIREKGIPEENVRAVPGELVEYSLGHNTIGQLLDPMDYTAIVSFRDEVSYPVMQVLRERGISVPEEMSIISFDNLRAENPSRPALTSIYTDRSIAEIGVKLLLERMEDPTLEPRNVVLPVRIFEDGTTAAPYKK